MLSTRHSTKSNFLYILGLALFVVNLFSISFAYFALSDSYYKHHQQAVVNTTNLAKILERSVYRLLEKNDLLLNDVAENSIEIENNQPTNDEILYQIISKEKQSHLQNITLLNLKGEVIFNSQKIQLPPALINQYVLEIGAKNLRNELLFSNPFQIDNIWVATIVKKILNKNNVQIGTIFTVFDLNGFNNLFSTVDVGSKGSIVVRKNTFEIMARFPKISHIGLRDSAQELVEAFQERSEAGSFQAVTPYDGVARTLSYRKIENYPFYVIAGSGRDDYLADWYDDLQQISTFITLFLIFSVTGSYFIYRSHKRAREKDLRLKLILNSTGEAIYGVDVDGNFTFCNHALLRILGYSDEGELLGKNVHQLIHSRNNPDDSHCVICQSAKNGGTIYKTHEQFWRADGTTFPVEYWSYPKYEEKVKIGAVVAFVDYTEKKKIDDTMWKQANYDTLTDLPNRALFHHALQEEINTSLTNSTKFAVLFIDLDRFKDVNDSLGHGIGDKLLQEAASRLTKAVRNTDLVARLGGDEFTIILPNYTNKDMISRVTDGIIKAMNAKFVIDSNEINISASIGITTYPEDAPDVENLLKNADQAMYMAKSKGRNAYQFFEQEMMSRLHKRLDISNTLESALQENQFHLYLQPIIETESKTITKAEVLLRWIHPTKGFISPMDFIPIAEDTGFITELGDWVFKQSALLLRDWQKEQLVSEHFKLCVNVSPIQFLLPNLVEDWAEFLKTINLNPTCLVIEITEGLLLDERRNIADKINQFRKLGIQIAIDDFGTGYSAMSYLYKYDIDYMKIDKSFIDNIMLEGRNKSITRALILMAHQLNIAVIAEGIEEKVQMDMLTDAHCDFLQGYLLYRPMPTAQLAEELLRLKNLEAK